MRKSAVYSSSTGWIFRIAPWGTLATAILMLLLLPAACSASPIAFTGDLVVFVYLAGMGRMLTVLAAMETASAFEGMGASRECQFSILAEGVLLTVLAALVMLTGKFNLSGCLTTLSINAWICGGTALLFLAVAFYLVMLCENCRVPVDDPETHLELTMIHEAMILDYSGADLAAILYASSLKLWIFAAFITSLLIPPGVFTLWQETALFFGGIIALAVLTGIVESSMARFRFLKVPPLLIVAAVIPVLALFFRIFFLGGVK